MKLKLVELRDNQKFSIHSDLVKGKIVPIEMTPELAGLMQAQLLKSTRSKDASVSNISTILDKGYGELYYRKNKGWTVCTVTAKIMLNHVVITNDKGGGINVKPTEKWYAII